MKLGWISKKILMISWIMTMLFCNSMVSSANYQLPAAVGYVNDFARVLTSPIKQQLSKISQELREKTGVELVIVTLPSLDGHPIEEVTGGLGRRWKIGQAGKANGIIVLLAIQENKLHLEVGYGIEPYLSETKAVRIRDRQMLPYIKQQDYQTAILEGSAAIALTIANGYQVSLNPANLTKQSMEFVQHAKFSDRLEQLKRHAGLFLLFVLMIILLSLRHPFIALLLFTLLGWKVSDSRHRFGSNHKASTFKGFGGSGGFGSNDASGG